MSIKPGEGMLPLIPLEPIQKGRTDGKVDPIEEMVGALTDPLIVFPPEADSYSYAAVGGPR